MYKEFIINKHSGTYSETLEAFGFAKLLNDIFQRLEISERVIIIQDKGVNFLVSTNIVITKEMLRTIRYFQVFKFLIKDVNTKIPEELSKKDCFDYPHQKQTQDQYKQSFKKIEENKNLSSEQKKNERKKLKKQKDNEFGESIDKEFDVYRELVKNPYTSYTNLFDNFYQNKDHFSDLLIEILDYYSTIPIGTREFKLNDETPTAQQLFNPNQGKGLNKNKANNASMGNLSSSWISETMKITGALDIMSVQYVKVGSGYDLKVYVPEFTNITFHEIEKLIVKFKRNLKSTSPMKLDILNVLNLIIKFIELSHEYKKGKVNNTIKGLHSVYQKDLGQNKAVANIAFGNIPDFIEYSNQLEAREWIEILTEHKQVISNIDESGESIQGFQYYRNFFGSTGTQSFYYFSQFTFWYSAFLSRQLQKENRFVKAFKIEHLNKLFQYLGTEQMDLTEIIENTGFQAVSSAIRKSTVSLQYTPKNARKFEIRYGLAQKLQSKSKSKTELATFIGEFIGIYNAETSRKKETSGASFRANVKDEELNEFFNILDSNDSKVIGALLSAYGFALHKKDNIDDETAKLSEQAEKLGYRLEKIETGNSQIETTIEENELESN